MLFDSGKTMITGIQLLYMRLALVVFLVAFCSPFAGARKQPNQAASVNLSSFEAKTVVSEMIQVMQADWPKAQVHLWIEPPVHPDFEQQLRHVGYTVTSDWEAGSVPVRWNFSAVGDSLVPWYRSSLRVNGDWVLTRFYKRDQESLVATTGFVFSGDRNIPRSINEGTYHVEKDNVLSDQPVVTRHWFVDVLSDLDVAKLSAARKSMKKRGYKTAIVPIAQDNVLTLRIGPMEQLATARKVLDVVRAEGFASASLVDLRAAQFTQTNTELVTGEGSDLLDPCTVLTVKTGSLRSNIARIVSECGYVMGEWRFVEGSRVQDWVVSNPYRVRVEAGIWGFIDLLADYYGIRSVLRERASIIDFQER